MASTRRKFYVVWEGRAPGIYDSWEECKAQTEGFPGARFKAFDNQEAATLAFRGNPADEVQIIRNIAQRRAAPRPNYAAIPAIRLQSIAVDAACSKNPGPMEYRGVDLQSGKTIFHCGPFPRGTNNIGEYLAIVHALALLDKRGDRTTAVYSDSRTAQSWLRHRKNGSKLPLNATTAQLHQILARADAWLQSHALHNPVLKWDTDAWGEIPADFGRK